MLCETHNTISDIVYSYAVHPSIYLIDEAENELFIGLTIVCRSLLRLYDLCSDYTIRMINSRSMFASGYAEHRNDHERTNKKYRDGMGNIIKTFGIEPSDNKLRVTGLNAEDCSSLLQRVVAMQPLLLTCCRYGVVVL